MQGSEKITPKVGDRLEITNSKGMAADFTGAKVIVTHIHGDGLMVCKSDDQWGSILCLKPNQVKSA